MQTLLDQVRFKSIRAIPSQGLPLLNFEKDHHYPSNVFSHQCQGTEILLACKIKAAYSSLGFPSRITSSAAAAAEPLQLRSVLVAPVGQTLHSAHGKTEHTPTDSAAIPPAQMGATVPVLAHGPRPASLLRLPQAFWPGASPRPFYP